MTTEQISGVLVHARSPEIERVLNQLNAMPGVDVQSNLGAGRLAVLVESAGDEHIADRFADIRNVEGVLSASLTYYFTEESRFLDEEIVP